MQPFKAALAACIIFFALSFQFAGDAAAQATRHGDCVERIAAIVAEREAQNKLALDQRNRKFTRADKRYQQGVDAELKSQFDEWLVKSDSIQAEYIAMRTMPQSEAKLARHAEIQRKFDRARGEQRKAQQEILLKWRTSRFDQIKAAQTAFEKAIKRNNAKAQKEIERLRKIECVTR